MLRSYVDNGEIRELARSDYNYNQNLQWLQTHILPYMSYISASNCNDPNQYRKNAVCVQLTNGELFEFVVDYNGADILFFPDGKWLNIQKEPRVQRRVFPFQFSKRAQGMDDTVIKSKIFVEPYSYTWNGSKSDLYNNSNYGCKNGKKGKWFCGKIIQDNGWTIPDDYPW